MPKAKPKRSPAKASPKRATKPTPKTRAAKASKPKSSARNAQKPRNGRNASAIDARVLAAIGLALEDERVASERAEALAQPLSPWAESGRARAVKTR